MGPEASITTAGSFVSPGTAIGAASSITIRTPTFANRTVDQVTPTSVANWTLVKRSRLQSRHTASRSEYRVTRGER